jgi:hypothetical protein
MNHATKRRVTVLATLTSVMLIAGVAFAAWTSTGSGSGAATADLASNASTVASAAAGDDLFPGADTTISVTVTNNEAYPVMVSGFDAGSSSVIADPACAAGTVTTDADSSPADTVIEPGETADYDLDAHMINDPANGCQGASFSIPLDFDLVSAAHD